MLSLSGFDAFVNVGKPTYGSFYRERKVSEDEFWSAFNATVSEYSILNSDEYSDLCAWSNGDLGNTVPSIYDPGYAACVDHLGQSFEMKEE